jgi:hypothetical protein
MHVIKCLVTEFILGVQERRNLGLEENFVTH